MISDLCKLQKWLLYFLFKSFCYNSVSWNIHIQILAGLQRSAHIMPFHIVLVALMHAQVNLLAWGMLVCCTVSSYGQFGVCWLVSTSPSKDWCQTIRSDTGQYYFCDILWGYQTVRLSSLLDFLNQFWIEI